MIRDMQCVLDERTHTHTLEPQREDTRGSPENAPACAVSETKTTPIYLLVFARRAKRGRSRESDADHRSD